MLARLVATTTLGAFLLAQPGILCAPLCLSQVHERLVAAASHFQDHVVPCHPERVIRSQLPTAQLLGSMLPEGVAQLAPRPQIVRVRFGAPAETLLQQIPSTDPPPPRTV